MAGGRPTIYTEELANKICELVATHPYGLPKLCKMFPELPNKDTINVWRWEKPGFSAKYTEAKQFQSELMAESIEDVAEELHESSYVDGMGVTKIDPGMLGYARLVCDNRKWTAAKLAPKIYGERKQPEDNLSASDTLNKVKQLVADLNKVNESDV